MREEYAGELVGISYARSYKELDMWKRFLDVLEVNYIISDKNLDDAANLASERFRYAGDYCFTRRATLGEYIFLVEEKNCQILLVASRVVEGNTKCNTTRYVPLQIAGYYSEKEIRVIDAPISTDEKVSRMELYKLGKQFSDDEIKIQRAIDSWFTPKTSVKKRKGIKKDSVNLFFIGGAPFHFSFSDPNSYMTRYLRDRLGVNVVGPKSASEIKNFKIFREAYRTVYPSNLVLPDRQAYWVRENILASYLNVRDEIDGVVFVRDKYCTCKIEEINLLHQIIEKDNCPNIVVDYREEARTTVETTLEAFIEMIKMKRRGGVV